VPHGAAGVARVVIVVIAGGANNQQLSPTMGGGDGQLFATSNEAEGTLSPQTLR